jgi:amino acid adenylation domain-containing protein
MGAARDGRTGRTERTRDAGLVHDRLRDLATVRPDGLAVADACRSLTFRELDERANALAHRLRDLGVTPGVRVGLCHERAAITVVGALATLKAGGAYVGLDPAYPEARLEHVLRDSGAPVLLAQRSIADRLAPVCDVVIDLDEEPGLSETLGQPPRSRAGADDPAYVIYTSGSTGSPKGVAVSHRSLTNLVDWHNEAFSVGPEDRASVVASPAFDASVWELWPALVAGASLHIPEPKTLTAPDQLRDWLVGAGITIAFVPTPLAELLLALEWPNESPLRFLLTGGDRLRRRPAPGAPFTLVNNYGVAEGAVVSTSGVVAASTAGSAQELPGIGRAIAGVRLHVLDADGRPVETGEIGELFIGGAGVAIGYINRPELTAARFIADPFATVSGARLYRTGDLVRVAADGEHHFIGRVDDQVQIRGQRVEPEEAAAALRTHASVDRCVVVADESRSGAVRMVAYVVAAPGVEIDAQSLRDHVARRLPSFMVPSVIVALAELPLTENGKVDRNALPAPAAATAPATDRPAPATPTERVVTALLEELLELDWVAPDDNFFELGGHSLMAAQLIIMLEDSFGLEIELITVFDNPTAAGLAAVIEREL